MIEVGENATFHCGKDPPYYTNTIGIVVDWVIVCVGLPEVCLACYALLSLLKRDRAAPIFSLNLLLSDMVQITITIVFVISRCFDQTLQPYMRARCIARLFVHLGLSTSLGFMLMISAERYLMVAYPVWYHTTNTARLSILISICLWTLSLTYSTLDYVFLIHTKSSVLLFSILCLVPAPFLVGFFTATWRALNKSAAMRQKMKNNGKVLGALSLVLGTYTIMFLPFIFRNLCYSLKGYNPETVDSVRDLSSVLTSALVYLSPLADCFIYIFLRRDIRNTMDAFPCCRRQMVKLKKCQDGLTDNKQKETVSNN